jgi:hypothetical protein
MAANHGLSDSNLHQTHTAGIQAYAASSCNWAAGHPATLLLYHAVLSHTCDAALCWGTPFMLRCAVLALLGRIVLCHSKETGTL